MKGLARRSTGGSNPVDRPRTQLPCCHLGRPTNVEGLEQLGVLLVGSTRRGGLRVRVDSESPQSSAQFPVPAVSFVDLARPCIEVYAESDPCARRWTAVCRAACGPSSSRCSLSSKVALNPTRCSSRGRSNGSTSGLALMNSYHRRSLRHEPYSKCGTAKSGNTASQCRRCQQPRSVEIECLETQPRRGNDRRRGHIVSKTGQRTHYAPREQGK